MLRAKIKISGEKPNIVEILNKLPVVDYKYDSVGDDLFLELIINSKETLFEAIRRLGPKSNRKDTHLELLSKEETLSKSFSYVREKVRTRNIGWKTKLLYKGYTLYLTINKVVAVGNNLAKGKELYCYEAEDENGRPIMITYLDGLPKEPAKEIDVASYASFISEQDGRLQRLRKRPKHFYTGNI